MKEYTKMLIGNDTPFGISEAFKEIRTNMLYTARGLKCPIYAVTSAFAHEGKSLIAANLALSFAKLGKHVLLLDGDLRSPSLHKFFATDRSFGISEVAAGMCDNWEKVIQKTDDEGLDFVPAGHIPPNPSELLSSAHFTEFVLAMQEKYDAIFIDFPPVGVVVDALIPAAIVTGYAVVVRSGVSDRRAIAEVLSSLRGVGANVLGFVLNDVDPKQGGYGRGERSKYRYRYKYNYSYMHPSEGSSEENNA